MWVRLKTGGERDVFVRKVMQVKACGEGWRGWRWGGEAPCHCTCTNNRKWQQGDKQLQRGLDVSLLYFGAPPECSNMNGTTNSIWRWLKCLSPSVWSEKLLRLSLSVKDQTSDSACLSPFTTNCARLTFLQITLRKNNRVIHVLFYFFPPITVRDAISFQFISVW